VGRREARQSPELAIFWL